MLSGHFDVVSTEEYGKAEPWAYEVGTSKLEEMLRKMPLDDVAKADLESGEWIWGRGVADMKGGLAIHARRCLSSMPNRPSGRNTGRKA